mmetsp:Transcript_4577/g.6943  ORF Transcript_4577/g.6943 Transcript_4577/m.6943 type:complete len:208 (-) Transcript_4577:1198-1821(-)
MSHHGQSGLVHVDHLSAAGFLLHEGFDIPDLNSVVLACTHERLAGLGGEVDAADGSGVTLEEAEAHQLLELGGQEVVFPKEDLAVFGTGQEEAGVTLDHLVDGDDNVGMAAVYLELSRLQIHQLKALRVRAEHSLLAFVDVLDVNDFIQVQAMGVNQFEGAEGLGLVRLAFQLVSEGDLISVDSEHAVALAQEVHLDDLVLIVCSSL